MRLFSIFFFLLGFSSVYAADAPAIFVIDETKFEQAFVTQANATKVVYKITKVAATTKVVDRDKIQSIFFLEPALFTEAMTLFKKSRYEAAYDAFKICQKAFQKVDSIPGNYSTLAGFYAMECLRLSGDLKALSAEFDKFSKRDLVQGVHKKQLDVYALWLAVNDKSWSRLVRLSEEMLPKTKVNSLRAQVAYCYGLGLQKTEHIDEALNAYAIAMTADYGSSKVIVQKAMENSLAMFKADKNVKQALKLYGTADENKKTIGFQRLIEAGAIAASYEMIFGADIPLPEEYAEFKKIVPAR